MNMVKPLRKLAIPLLIATLALTGTALAQDKPSEHDAHAAKAEEGAKTMMDGCDMMKGDPEKGSKMMGEGHAKMMEGMKMAKMDPAMKKKMMAADKKMMMGKKMMMDGMKMMQQGKEEMSKLQPAKP